MSFKSMGKSYLHGAAWGAGASAVNNAAYNARIRNEQRQREAQWQQKVNEATIQKQGVWYEANARVFGQAGMSLTGEIQDMDTKAQASGVRGEERVARKLQELAALYPNAYVFHSMKLPNQIGDMDHIVIQGDRMIIIDAKNWRGDKTYSIMANDDESTIIFRDGEAFGGGEVHLNRQKRDWSAYASQSGIASLNSVLVIANDNAVIENYVPNFDFVNLSQLEEVFTYYLTQDAQPISEYNMLHRWLPLVQGFAYTDRATGYQAGVGIVMQGTNANAEKFVGGHDAADTMRGSTIALVVWSFLNYLMLPLAWYLAPITVPALIVFAHIRLHKINKYFENGGGWMIATLIFQYILLAIIVIGALSLIPLALAGTFDPTSGLEFVE